MFNKHDLSTPVSFPKFDQVLLSSSELSGGGRWSWQVVSRRAARRRRHVSSLRLAPGLPEQSVGCILSCKQTCCHILCASFKCLVQIFQLLSNLSNVWSCVRVWLLTCVLWPWAQATHFAFCNSLSTLVTWNHGFVGRRRFCYFGFGGDNTARSSTTPSDF